MSLSTAYQAQDLNSYLKRTNLHGANIYKGSCTLKVEFAKQEMLNVKSNNDRTWDFTVGESINGNGEASEARVRIMKHKLYIDFYF